MTIELQIVKYTNDGIFKLEFAQKKKKIFSPDKLGDENPQDLAWKLA